MGRAPLVGMLWRVKTDEADAIITSALDHPDTARDAMSALRRRLGNSAARALLEPLRNHAEPFVADAAKDHLRRIGKALSKI